MQPFTREKGFRNECREASLRAQPLGSTKRVCHAPRRQRSRTGLSGRVSAPPSACDIRPSRRRRTFRILHSGDGDRLGRRVGAHGSGPRPTSVGIGDREASNALHRRQDAGGRPLGGDEIAPCSGPEHQYDARPSQSVVEIDRNPLTTWQIAAFVLAVLTPTCALNIDPDLGPHGQDVTDHLCKPHRNRQAVVEVARI